MDDLKPINEEGEEILVHLETVNLLVTFKMEVCPDEVAMDANTFKEEEADH